MVPPCSTPLNHFLPHSLSSLLTPLPTCYPCHVLCRLAQTHSPPPLLLPPPPPPPPCPPPSHVRSSTGRSARQPGGTGGGERQEGGPGEAGWLAVVGCERHEGGPGERHEGAGERHESAWWAWREVGGGAWREAAGVELER